MVDQRSTTKFASRAVFGVFALVMLFIFGAWIGYRTGFKRGYAAELPKPDEAEYVRRVYPVADLVLRFDALNGTYEADFESLMSLTTGVVSPADWKLLGGAGTIEADPATLSVIVSQTATTLREVESLFTSLRENRRADLHGPRSSSEHVSNFVGGD